MMVTAAKLSPSHFQTGSTNIKRGIFMWIGFASLTVSGFLISHPKTFIHFLRLMSSEKFIGLHLLPKDLHPPATSLQGIDYACNRMIMRFSIAFDHRWGTVWLNKAHKAPDCTHRNIWKLSRRAGSEEGRKGGGKKVTLTEGRKKEERKG